MKGSFVIGMVLAAAAWMIGSPGSALAHCDTLDGPVVKAARQSLDKGDVNLVLPWVPAEKEGEIREAYALAAAVRGKGTREKELADRFFFETLVRVHRAGEGEPYTGLKAAGLDLGPAIPAADKALETGDPGPLLELIGEKVRSGIHRYYTEARERKELAGRDVPSGRAYVQAYVPYLHFVERIYNDASSPIAHGSGEGGRPGGHGEEGGAAEGHPHGSHAD